MESPYKFLDSYTKDDRDIFFGRDLEVEEVYTKVFQAKTLFVYGESGTGKSSLVNCGLANKFKDTDWLPVNVRRGENINESVIQELERLTLTQVKNLNGSFSGNLFKYTRSLYLDYFKPIYFIFDQFEELYLMGSKDEWMEFVQGIRALTEKDIQVRFIFVIRAEYLHFMTEFEEDLPDIFNNKLRIEKITRLKARECIEGPSRMYGIQLEENFSDLLFDQLSPDSNEIELTYLQVFLDRVFKKAKQNADNGDLIFTKEILDEIGMVNDVLSDFLDEQINTMANKESALTVLKSFVTIEGTKKQSSITEIKNFTFSIGEPLEEDEISEIIKSLLESRILKELPDHQSYELRHDALASKIFEKITLREREMIEVRQFLDYGYAEYQKRGFLLNEQDLDYVLPHIPKLGLGKEIKDFVDASSRAVGRKKRIRKRIIITIIVIIALSITSVWGFFYAQRQKKEAIEQKSVAELNAFEAEKQKTIAEENAGIALQAKKSAELNANEANFQKEIADQQRLIAEMQRAAADSSRIEAEQQKLQALIQKDSAESARELALKYLNQANTERVRAERLSMQSLARSLGIKASQLPDLELKSLLALQAYRFNREFSGYQYQADIYNGIYQAYKQAKGSEFNVFKEHTSAVTDILHRNNTIYTTGSDGKIINWSEDLGTFKIMANTSMINNSMAISPDNSKMVIGTTSSTIFVYEIGSGEVLSRYTAHNGEVWEVLFPDDLSIISSGEDKKIYQWDLETGGRKELVSEDYNAHALAYCKPQNKLLFGMDNGLIYDIDLSTFLKSEIGGRTSDMVTQLAFSHDYQFLAAGYESGTIQLLKSGSFEVIETLPGHIARVTDLKFSESDKFLASGGFDRKSLIWNLENIKEQPISLADHETFVWSVSFTGHETLVGELNGTIKKYYLEMSNYADRICSLVSRNMTTNEWQLFIPGNIQYEITCIERK